MGRKIKVDTLSEDEIQAPPGWITRIYLGLEPPAEFDRSEIVEGLDDQNRIDQFLRKSQEYHLLKKLDRGRYFAVDPCVAINCWAVDDHYADLLVLESFFEHLGVEHAFLGLSGSEHADYVPDRPMIVTREELGYGELDPFVYDFSDTEKIDMKVMKRSFELPLLNEEETALLFLSTYLSREVKAGKEILDGVEIDDEVKDKLLGLGYSGYGGKKPVDLEIRSPRWVKKKQGEIGLSRLKEVATR